MHVKITYDVDIMKVHVDTTELMCIVLGSDTKDLTRELPNLLKMVSQAERRGEKVTVEEVDLSNEEENE